MCVGGGGVGHNNSGVGRGQKQFGKGGIGEGKIGGGEQENYWVVKISCTFLLPANIFCYHKTSVPKKDFSTHLGSSSSGCKTRIITSRGGSRKREDEAKGTPEGARKKEGKEVEEEDSSNVVRYASVWEKKMGGRRRKRRTCQTEANRRFNKPVPPPPTR